MGPPTFRTAMTPSDHTRHCSYMTDLSRPGRPGNVKSRPFRATYGPHSGVDLRFHSPQPNISLHGATTATRASLSRGVPAYFPAFVVTRLAHPGEMARLSWPRRLINYQDGVNATRTRERSPIPVLTGPDLRCLGRSRPTRCNYAKLPTLEQCESLQN